MKKGMQKQEDQAMKTAELSPILEKELETYQRELPKLSSHAGKFALIGGSELLGVYGTYEDALAAGYEKCKMDPFLVKQIQVVEQVQHFTRDVVPTSK